MSFADRIPPNVRDKIEQEAAAMPPARPLDAGEVRCSLCGSATAARRAYRRVQGWERERSQGGTNHVVLRETRDEYACVHCITKLRDGIAIGQDTLV